MLKTLYVFIILFSLSVNSIDNYMNDNIDEYSVSTEIAASTPTDCEVTVEVSLESDDIYCEPGCIIEPVIGDINSYIVESGEEQPVPLLRPELGPLEYNLTEPEPVVTKYDEYIDLIALITMAEAEGEPEDGKRLVIDTILNRVDHPYWPDTVDGVIYQSGQFSCVWNGRVNSCYVTDYYRNLVKEEIANRKNSSVVYFQAGWYSGYGTPLFQVGNHYFSAE